MLIQMELNFNLIVHGLTPKPFTQTCDAEINSQKTEITGFLFHFSLQSLKSSLPEVDRLGPKNMDIITRGSFTLDFQVGG